MLCHVVSWSGCGWRICCGPFRHGVALPGRGSGVSARLARLRVFGRAVPLPRPRRRPACAAEPFPARIACVRPRAWPRALRGGANRAPDCACAREGATRRAAFGLDTDLQDPAGGRRRRAGARSARRAGFRVPGRRGRVRSRAVSWNVMVPMQMAHMLWSFRAWIRPFRPALRGFRPVVPASRLRQGRLVPPAPPPALLCSGTLCRAYRARLIVPARATPRRVISCHGPDAAGAYAAVLSDMEPPFPAGVPGFSSGCPGFASSAGAFRSPGPAAGPPVQRKPFPRVTRVPPAARYAPCHVLSWSTLRLAHMLRSFRAWSRPSRPGFRGVRPVVPASRLRQGRFVPPAPPPARLCSGTLSHAYRLRPRVRLRALRGGAVRAPDCACARGRNAARRLRPRHRPPGPGRREAAALRSSPIRQAGRISCSGPVRPRDPVQCHVLSWSRCG